jgi:DNA-binding FadR family transcriptional regulator
MSGMIGDVLEYSRAQEEHLALAQTVKALREIVAALTRGAVISAHDASVDLLETLEARLNRLDERRNRPKEPNDK